MKRHAIGLLAALALPPAARAQDAPPAPEPDGGTVIRGPRRDFAVYAGGGPVYGPGYFHSGWPYGPRTAPPWNYPGLAGGPYIGYPWGFYGYSGRAGSFWSNGLSLYGPPVPVYGPIPGVMGNDDLVRRWRDWPGIGLPFGWIGIYAASPRPRPLSVSVWPGAEPVGNWGGGRVGKHRHHAATAAPPAPPPAVPQGSLVLSVKVPQPAAEVLVDGVRTVQTGTDRIFESPPLEAGKEFRYELTARWVERGVTREAKRVVTGTPGEVVRVDFTAPEVIATAGK